MCDVCSEVIELLQRNEKEIQKGELRYLFRQEMNILCAYVQSWIQRQCTCCFKDPKNFDRFNVLVQGFALSIIEILQQIPKNIKLQKSDELSLNSSSKKITSNSESQDTSFKEKDKNVSNNSTEETEKNSSQLKNSQSERKDIHEEDWSLWTNEDKEKILHTFSKVFLQNFPLYVAFKHCFQSEIDDMDIPVYLLRNVCFFCDKGGLKLFIACFQDASPETLPMTLAHAMITVISNLKLWMNIGSMMQYLVPLRSCVIRYLCQVKDSHLRAVGNRNLFEFMWNAVKDPLDPYATFDKESLDLAFKCFNSTILLTMRLAGIYQINSHINMYKKLCHNESLVEAENVRNDLANWLINNKIIECIFGPNLQVELIKESHIILNFLAMEGRITNEHIDVVWSAAQLKHCNRQVLKLLSPLIKNLEITPLSHFYKLFSSEETEEQTELLDSSQISDRPRSSIEVSEHTGGSPSSSPYDVEQHKQLMKQAHRKRTTSQRHQNGRKWQHACAGPAVFVENKTQLVENCSSGEESELSSVTDDSLHSDTDAGDCSEEPLVVDVPVGKAHLIENSEDSSRDCNDMWSHKVIRRARYVANKKQSRCMKKEQSNSIIKAELSEESVENCNPNASIHDTSSINCVTPVKDNENNCKKFINNTSEHKHSELSHISDKKLAHRPAAPPILPELVKAVLERDKNISGFQEGIDNDMYGCRQYIANLRPQRHVPVPGDNYLQILAQPTPPQSVMKSRYIQHCFSSGSVKRGNTYIDSNPGTPVAEFSITDNIERQKCLDYAETAGLDVSQITKTVVRNIREKGHVTAEQMTDLSAITTEDDLNKINAIDWLIFDPHQRAEAMKQANALMRIFLIQRKIKAAKQVFAKVPSDSVAVMMQLAKAKGHEELLADDDNATREYLCFRAYLEAMDAFNNWFHHSIHAKPKEPLAPSGDNVIFKEKVAYEHELQQYEKDMERWCNVVSILSTTASDCLYNVLLFINGGWMVDQRSDGTVDENRQLQMCRLRKTCIPHAIRLLQDLLINEGKHKEAVSLADIVSSERYQLYKEFTHEDIKQFLRVTLDSSFALLDKNLDPLGYNYQ